MTRNQAIRHVKAWIKQKYGRQEDFARAKSKSITAMSHAVNSLAPWLLKECGLVRQVEVTYEVTE